MEKTEQIFNIIKNYDYENSNLMEITCLLVYSRKSINIFQKKIVWNMMNGLIEKLENYLLLNFDLVKKIDLEEQKSKILMKEPDISYQMYIEEIWNYYVKLYSSELDYIYIELNKKIEEFKMNPDNEKLEICKELHNKLRKYGFMVKSLDLIKIMNYFYVFEQLNDIFSLINNFYSDHINLDEINDLYENAKENNIEYLIFDMINDKIKSNIDDKKIELIKNNSEELINQSFYEDLQKIGKDNLLERYENLKNNINIDLFVKNYMRNTKKNIFDEIDEINKYCDKSITQSTFLLLNILGEEKINNLNEFMPKLIDLNNEFEDELKKLIEKYYIEDEEYSDNITIENMNLEEKILLSIKIKNILLRVKERLDNKFLELCENIIQKNRLQLSEITKNFMIDTFKSIKDNTYLSFNINKLKLNF